MPSRRSSFASFVLGVLPVFLPLAGSTVCADFNSSWNLDHDRIWVGSAYHANRWQDWCIHTGRLECTEVGSRLPMRTVQVLTSSLAPQNGPIQLKVALGEIDAAQSFAANSRGGLILGCGGPDVDYRLTALVHHQPAPDGGVLVLVDERGSVTIRSNEEPIKSRSTWSISGDVTDAELPLLSEQTPVPDPAGEALLSADGLELRVDILPDGDLYEVRARVFDSEGSTVFSEAVARGLSLPRVEGGFGVVSNHGPVGSRNGWWFRGLSATGSGVVDHARREFGPILGALYTLDGSTVKMTAQFPPLGVDDNWSASLQIQPEPRATWKTIDRSDIDPDSRTALFRVEDWTFDRPIPYRVVYSLPRTDGSLVADEYQGVIRPQPLPVDPLLIASLSCHKTFTGGLSWNSNGLWFPHQDMVEALVARDPDLVFFAGDQIYEGDLTPASQRNEDAFILDYLWKYTHWYWAFNELMRDRPTVVIPDDHDVYHGNIWGAGGIRAKARDGMTQQDAGGYKLSADMVNAIHRTQVGNLPECRVPGPIGQGIDPYTTRLKYGPADFAIVADRMWKDSATVKVPEGKVRNGWFRNPDFDPRDADVEGAEFLGATQEAFLKEWAADRDPKSPRKIVLSQTPWVNVATLPPGRDDGVVPRLTIHKAGEYAEDDQPAADTDSGGWPQAARTRAVRSLAEADALHLCGDQHLGSLVQYGVDEFRDGTFAFTPPAVANTWPRRWMPIEPGGDVWEGAPRYAGDFEDGFGNLVTVFVVTNPEDRRLEPRRLFDLSPGYGIIDVDPVDGSLLLEAWPRWADPTDDAQQYDGFPFTIPRKD